MSRTPRVTGADLIAALEAYLLVLHGLPRSAVDQLYANCDGSVLGEQRENSEEQC